jgi:D-beta-D-heptose 7-phosphate kinase/D-beta-D-heptose 1-phosphate adenosyltransferase
MSAPQDLLRHFDRFDETRVLVIGDIMLDRFMYGSVERISPEAPIPIFTQQREERMLGGAGNVVRNLLSLGSDVTFISVIGDDNVGNQLTALVGAEKKLLPYLISERGRISSKKTRYVAGSQQLLRSDHESKSDITDETAAKLLDAALSELPRQHAVILSDYGKGTLTATVIHTIIEAARAANVPVFVDPKKRDVGIYSGATVLSPNAKELALAVSVDGFRSEEALIGAASSLCAAHQFQYVLATRGEHGMTLVDAAGLLTHIEAEAHEVFDVSGAGDTVIATLALSYAAGASMTEAAQLANLAAGVVVGRLGTATVYRTDITTALYAHRAVDLQKKIVPLSHARAMVDNWRREGLSVGFTNGCFDIMHAGHISLMLDAASRCDRLIVGLNTDASVRGLKGPTRPVNSEMDRAQVLAALSMVAVVVLFDEETPMNLIRTLEPDVLMKGADYTKEQVVGWELVESYGGRVELIQLKQGYSTTGIISKMSQPAA